MPSAGAVGEPLHQEIEQAAFRDDGIRDHAELTVSAMDKSGEKSVGAAN